MRNNLWLVLIALLVGGSMAAACGGDGDDRGSTADTVEGGDDGDSADGDSDSGTDEPAGSNGEDAGTDGGEDSGVGVPLPPSADAVSTMESGPATVVQFIVPLDEQDATIAFYDDWTESQPDTYIRTEAETGGVTWQNDPDPGSDAYIIAVLSPLEGDDFITVTITAGSLE